MESIFEKCVSCGKETTTPIDMHIDFRAEYVEGIGQFCHKCYTTEKEKLDDNPNYPRDIESF